MDYYIYIDGFIKYNTEIAILILLVNFDNFSKYVIDCDYYIIIFLIYHSNG